MVASPAVPKITPQSQQSSGWPNLQSGVKYLGLPHECGPRGPAFGVAVLSHIAVLIAHFAWSTLTLRFCKTCRGTFGAEVAAALYQGIEITCQARPQRCRSGRKHGNNPDEDADGFADLFVGDSVGEQGQPAAQAQEVQQAHHPQPGGNQAQAGEDSAPPLK